MKEQSNNYVYAVSRDNMHYIGARSCNEEPKDDIGIKYFTSSNDNLFKKFFKTYPKEFSNDILGNFKTRKEAMECEILWHKVYDVGANPKFWNRAMQTSTGFDTTGNVDTRLKISKTMTGLKKTSKHKRKISEALSGENHFNFGKNLSVKTRSKISEKSKARVGEKNNRFGVQLSYETRLQISTSNKLAVKHRCMYCNAEMQRGHITRYHNNNCKFKPREY